MVSGFAKISPTRTMEKRWTIRRPDFRSDAHVCLRVDERHLSPSELGKDRAYVRWRTVLHETSFQLEDRTSNGRRAYDVNGGEGSR